MSWNILLSGDDRALHMPAGDLNPHAKPAADFKSAASAIPPGGPAPTLPPAPARCPAPGASASSVASGVRNALCADSVTFASVVSSCPAAAARARTRPARHVAMRPARSAAIIAASSTSAPRAVFTRIAPGRSFPSRSADRNPRVSSVSSRCTDSTWLSRQQRIQIHERAPPARSSGVRFHASTRIPDPPAIRATSAAIPPNPSSPIVLPVSCMPLGARSSCRARMPRSIRASPRAAAHIRAIACSATAVSP